MPRWFARLLVVLNHRTHVSAYSHCEHHYKILNILAYAIWYPHSFSCIMLVNIHNTTFWLVYIRHHFNSSSQILAFLHECNYIGSRDFVWTHTGHSVHDLMNNTVSNSFFFFLTVDDIGTLTTQHHLEVYKSSLSSYGIEWKFCSTKKCLLDRTHFK